MTDQARRMHREALKWLNDADILAQSVRGQSDAQALLRTFGFEVLLKCAIVLSGVAVPKHHDYADLWRPPPIDAQREIMATAHDRSPGHADLSDLDRLFNAYRNFFERGRYYYKLYATFTLEQEHELGQLWEELGAPEHEAEIRFYPEELFCPISGLRAFIEARS